MDASQYGSLLEKTRLPQPLLQRSAVSALFQKLRAAPPHRGFESREGRDAVSLCLGSSSAAVVDQSVRELCRLVAAGVVKVEPALVELQSALEGCEARFVSLFVKGIGFLCRCAFREDPSQWRSQCQALDLHPFVRTLSCRPEVQEELRRQVLMFILHNRTLGMEAVSEFIRPFVLFSVLTVESSLRSLIFAKDLVSDLASLCCALPTEAMAIMRLVTGYLEYFPRSNDEEFRCLTSSAECLVDAFEMVLKKMAQPGMPIAIPQIFRLELLETLLSICTELDKPYRWMTIVELSMRLLVAQRDISLPYLPEFSSVSISLSVILSRAEFEHEQVTILKALIFLRQWLSQDMEKNVQESAFYPPFELLQIFPAINVLSSTSESVKDAVVSFLSTFETYNLNLPAARRKYQSKISVLTTRCKLGSVLIRLLEHLWTERKNSFCGSFLMELTFEGSLEETPDVPVQWLLKLKGYSSVTVQQSKFIPFFHHQGSMFTGIPLLLSSVASTFIYHPQLMSLAVDSLSSLASMDPKYGVTFLLGNLFYVKIFSTSRNNSPKNLHKLLGMLPPLASSSAMVPLILQILMPLLREDAKIELYALAVRLLCKTWTVADRVFGTLQTILEPRAFSAFNSQKDACLSMAASIRDVCRHNPERGVDLILSISACIESRDSSVQALGFEAIAHMCEADVIDFYTAWNIIEKHKLDYSEDPVVALGLCTLLRWGAIDAEAYPEPSVKVIQTLWQAGRPNSFFSSQQRVKVCVSALRSLKYFEVDHILKAIPDFPLKSITFLVSEDNSEIQKAMEELVVRIVNFEHINRRRFVKDRKPVIHKVEKLLDIFPHAMFSSGGKQKCNIGEVPGAALLSVTFTSKDTQDASKLHGKYEAMLLEVADSLHLGRNIFVALLAFQSWKSFLNRWLRAVTDTVASANVPADSSKSASIILKILMRIAEESIPRVAENIALAIGALCMVLPPSGYSVLSNASAFLLKWLFHQEHEHRQWPAAISLGLISNSLHITDESKKVNIVNALVEVIQNTRSCLVKGACGTGLGLTCQKLLSQISSDSEGTKSEMKLLGKILRSLCSVIIQICPSSADLMMSLHGSFPLNKDKAQAETLTILPSLGSDKVDDLWGAEGLVLGLGNTVSVFYRLGAYGSIKIIKNVLLSWIPSEDKVLEIPLSIGSCLVLPTVVNFWERTEVADTDLPGLVRIYSSLVSRLAATEDSGAAHQNLVMASSIGAGSLLSYIMNEGVQSLKYDDVRCLLENMRSLYTHPYPPIIQLGGMLGVVNSFGAGAVNMMNSPVVPSTLRTDDLSKNSLYIRGPIINNPTLEPLCTSLIQEMFVIAKESTDKQTRRNAAWSISFLRQWWWSQDSQNVQESKVVPENTLVWGLYSWLNEKETDDLPDARTVSSVFRCLSQAPRLPSVANWGAIVKRFMRYGAQSSAKLKPDFIREECLTFSLAHASTDTSVLLFLDDLVLISHFSTLELNLQIIILSRLSEFMRLFSASRMEKFYSDLVVFFSSSSSYMLYSTDERSLLRISFWKGLGQCVVNAPGKSETVLQVEECIDLLLSLLPVSLTRNGSGEGKVHAQELMVAVNCLSAAPQDWLMNLIQIPKVNLHAEAAKKVVITARLVLRGCVPVSELGKLRTFILNSESGGIWNTLLEVAAALHGANNSVKRQWILDAVEISCISPHPATALQFVGVLSGLCSNYMPLLILSSEAVLTDLPLTLPSLLSVNDDWTFIAEKLVNMLWESTKRICKWASQVQTGSEPTGPAQIDPSEKPWSPLLAYAMRETCLALKHHLPLEKRLGLATLPFPTLNH